MTLDEAIEYYIKVATQRAIADEEMGVNDKWNETKFMTKKESEQIIADNRQIAAWLTELKEAKRLLKLAVEDLSNIAAKAYNGGIICKCCKWLTETVYCKCPNNVGCDITYQWRYVDEALKLMGDESSGI